VLSMKLAINLCFVINVIGKTTKQSDPRWWFKTRKIEQVGLAIFYKILRK
jgi:hypothetical protein